MPMESDADWVRAIRTDAVPEGSIAAVEIDGHPVAIYHLEGGEFCATDNLCTHGAALLSDGYLDGDIVECPLHGGCFEVRSGKGLGDPIKTDLPTYPVRIEGPYVLVHWRRPA